MARTMNKEGEWEQALIAKFGFYIDYVTGEDYVNIHTHGLDNFNHLDLEIVLPISQDEVACLLHSAVSLIKQGKRFEAGKLYDCFFADRKVLMLSSSEGGREVLRMCVPDKNGRFEGEFEKQLEQSSEK